MVFRIVGVGKGDGLTGFLVNMKKVLLEQKALKTLTSHCYKSY